MSQLPTEPAQLARPAGSMSDVFTWPRRRRDGTTVETSVRFRLLTTADKYAARLDAERRVKKLCDGNDLDSKMIEEMRADQRTIEMLARACRKVDDFEQAWMTAMEIEALPEIEVALIGKAYTEFEESFGPMDHVLTLEKFDYWIEEAAKGEHDPLLLLGSPTRRAFIMLMAKELLSSRAGRSSSTSLGSDGFSESERRAVTVATHADLYSLEERLAAAMNGRLDELTREVGSMTLALGLSRSGIDVDDGGTVVDHG